MCLFSEHMLLKESYAPLSFCAIWFLFFFYLMFVNVSVFLIWCRLLQKNAQRHFDIFSTKNWILDLSSFLNIHEAL